MQSRALLAAADVNVTAAPMTAAAAYAGVAAVAAAGLRPAPAATEIGPGAGLFAETLRVAREIANPRKRREPEWVLCDFVAGLDGEARLAGFRAIAGDIAESAAPWAALTSNSFERLRDVIHELLAVLVVLLAAIRARAGVHAPQLVSVSRLRLRSLSIAPGAPPAPARLHPHEGLAAAA